MIKITLKNELKTSARQAPGTWHVISSITNSVFLSFIFNIHITQDIYSMKIIRKEKNSLCHNQKWTHFVHTPNFESEAKKWIEMKWNEKKKQKQNKRNHPTIFDFGVPIACIHIILYKSNSNGFRPWKLQTNTNITIIILILASHSHFRISIFIHSLSICEVFGLL